MSRIKNLLESYREFISTPWRPGLPPAQRVIFCIYRQEDELRLRAKIPEFEIATRSAGHDWAVYDLSDTFARWLSGLRYAANYFKKPHLLQAVTPQYLKFISDDFTAFLQQSEAGEDTVVALTGVGTLFGFLMVKEVVDKIAVLVPGRLSVFFPGTYENNNYRLLDAYDGWNYLAIPITSD